VLYHPFDVVVSLPTTAQYEMRLKKKNFVCGVDLLVRRGIELGQMARAADHCAKSQAFHVTSALAAGISNAI
jgi:hypothetical protein